MPWFWSALPRLFWPSPAAAAREYQQLWAHSRDDRLLWVPADADQIASAKPAGKKTPDDLLKLIPPLDPVSEARLIETAKEKLDIGRDKVRHFISLLIEDRKISEQPIKRDGKKRTASGRPPAAS
jgi:hypothetical protein